MPPILTNLDVTLKVPLFDKILAHSANKVSANRWSFKHIVTSHHSNSTSTGSSCLMS